MDKRVEPYREEANRIAAELLDHDWAAQEEPADFKVREGLYIADVEEDVRQFSDEVEALRALRLGFPAVRTAENRIVPVALPRDQLYPGFRVPRRRSARFPFLAESLYDFVGAWENTSALRTVVQVDTAVERFRTGLTDFLATRVASVVEFFGRKSSHGVLTVSLMLPKSFLAGMKKVKTVGFTVDVNAANSGLRVHVSPAFRRNWRVFGMPTNPVVNTLTGGIYEFGADSGLYGTSTITPDPATFDIPYQTVSPNLIL